MIMELPHLILKAMHMLARDSTFMLHKILVGLCNHNNSTLCSILNDFIAQMLTVTHRGSHNCTMVCNPTHGTYNIMCSSTHKLTTTVQCSGGTDLTDLIACTKKSAIVSNEIAHQYFPIYSTYVHTCTCMHISTIKTS